MAERGRSGHSGHLTNRQGGRKRSKSSGVVRVPRLPLVKRPYAGSRPSVIIGRKPYGPYQAGMKEVWEPPEAHHRYRLGPPPVVLPRTAYAEAKDGSMYSRGIDKCMAKHETMQHAKPKAEKANGRNMLVRVYNKRTHCCT